MARGLRSAIVKGFYEMELNGIWLEVFVLAAGIAFVVVTIVLAAIMIDYRASRYETRAASGR